jgi:hypothetical protein
MKFQRKPDVFLIVGIFVVLTVIFSLQTIMFFDIADLFFSVAQEAESLSTVFYDEFPEARVTGSTSMQSVFATVTIQCSNFTSLDKAVLLINGEEVGNFSDKQLTVKVQEGDVLAIDGSFYIHELVFEVVAASQNVAQPEIGQTVLVYGDVALLGQVRLK